MAFYSRCRLFPVAFSMALVSCLAAETANPTATAKSNMGVSEEKGLAIDETVTLFATIPSLEPIGDELKEVGKYFAPQYGKTLLVLYAIPGRYQFKTEAINAMFPLWVLEGIKAKIFLAAEAKAKNGIGQLSQSNRSTVVKNGMTALSFLRVPVQCYPYKNNPSPEEILAKREILSILNKVMNECNDELQNTCRTSERQEADAQACANMDHPIAPLPSKPLPEKQNDDPDLNEPDKLVGDFLREVIHRCDNIVGNKNICLNVPRNTIVHGLSCQDFVNASGVDPALFSVAAYDKQITYQCLGRMSSNSENSLDEVGICGCTSKIDWKGLSLWDCHHVLQGWKIRVGDSPGTTKNPPSLLPANARCPVL